MSLVVRSGAPRPEWHAAAKRARSVIHIVVCERVGMMEGAYFKGRIELLAWLNELLQVNYTKVEQCASGAAYCQIIDAVFPGKVPLSKVNFNARFEYEVR